MFVNHLFYALFPKNCFVCRSSVDVNSTLCLECHSNLELLEDYCHQCCHYIIPDIGCLNCEINPVERSISHFILGYAYENAVREAIIQLKYHHKMYMVRVIEELVGDMIEKNSTLLDCIDYIIPMPVDRVRLAGRGFNHMFEIAKAIQPLINKPILHNVLQKKSFTIPQSGLSRRERLKNLRSSFVCQSIQGNILLLDDVMTTGQTLHCASQSLRSAGVSNIIALVIAKV